MSDAFQNLLLSRRGFLNRTVHGAQVVGATVALNALGTHQAQARSDTNPFPYDVSRYLRTDPSLLRYQETAWFQSPKPEPRCLARDDAGGLWLASGKSIVSLSPEGSRLSEFTAGKEVCSLAVSGDVLYAAHREQIAVFDLKGVPAALWELPGKKPYATGIAVSANAVFVADAGNRIVHRFDRSGKALNRIGARDPARNIPGFIVPSPFFSVVLGKDGLLRVTNTGRHRVELYTPEGDLETSWGEPGAAIEHFCGCCNPIDLALLPDGRTVSFEKGIPRVKVYSDSGEFECVVAGPESFAENAGVCGPNDCTRGGMDGVVDERGRVFILDFVTGKVRVMEPKPKPA